MTAYDDSNIVIRARAIGNCCHYVDEVAGEVARVAARRRAEDGLIEIARILHDSRDIESQVPDDYRRQP